MVMSHVLRFAFALLSLLLGCLAQAAPTSAASTDRQTALSPRQIAVVVNDADLDSQEAGAYYLQARQVPPENATPVASCAVGTSAKAAMRVSDRTASGFDLPACIIDRPSGSEDGMI